MFERLLVILEPWFNERGFSFVKSKRVFQRRYEDSFCNFWLESIQGIQILLSYEIHFPEVEKKLAKIYTRKYSRYSSTLRINGTHFPGVDESSIFYEEDDMSITANKIKRYFDKYCFPYFSDYSSYEELDELLNNNPIIEDARKNNSYHTPSKSRMMLAGLIVKFMLDREAYLALLEKYKSELPQHELDRLKYFDSLDALLRASG